MENEEFKHLVRIANTDLDGNKPIHHSLQKIKGISFMFSNMLCNLAKIDKLKKTGYLSDEEIKRIDEVLRDPARFNAPYWMLNRRRNYEDNIDRHVVGSDLKFAVDSDIKTMKKIRCYKGIRHSLGLTVRGQRTRSNFRKNKGKVSLGVKKNPKTKAGRV